MRFSLGGTGFLTCFARNFCGQVIASGPTHTRRFGPEYAINPREDEVIADSAEMSSFEEQLVEHRIYLMRFARLQLRNDDWAEDSVSDTPLAALSRPQAFGNRSH